VVGIIQLHRERMVRVQGPLQNISSLPIQGRILTFRARQAAMQQSVNSHNQTILNIDEQVLIEKVHQAYSVAPKVFLPAVLLSLLLAAGV